MATLLVDSAFQTLGLTPVDAFIAQQVTKNRGATPAITTADQGYLYKGIGATTWMCVQAAMALPHQDILLVGLYGNNQLRDMVEQVQRFSHKLYLAAGSAWEPVGPEANPNVQWAQIDFTTKNRAEERVVGIPGFRPGKVFDDAFWKVRAIKRANGPFAMTAFIREEKDDEGDTHYFAYDEENQFLMELPFDGARKLAAKNEIKIQTWKHGDPVKVSGDGPAPRSPHPTHTKFLVTHPPKTSK